MNFKKNQLLALWVALWTIYKSTYKYYSASVCKVISPLNWGIILVILFLNLNLTLKIENCSAKELSHSVSLIAQYLKLDSDDKCQNLFSATCFDPQSGDLKDEYKINIIEAKTSPLYELIKKSYDIIAQKYLGAKNFDQYLNQQANLYGIKEISADDSNSVMNLEEYYQNKFEPPALDNVFGEEQNINNINQKLNLLAKQSNSILMPILNIASKKDFSDLTTLDPLTLKKIISQLNKKEVKNSIENITDLFKNLSATMTKPSKRITDYVFRIIAPNYKLIPAFITALCTKYLSNPSASSVIRNDPFLITMKSNYCSPLNLENLKNNFLILSKEKNPIESLKNYLTDIALIQSTIIIALMDNNLLQTSVDMQNILDKSQQALTNFNNLLNINSNQTQNLKIVSDILSLYSNIKELSDKNILEIPSTEDLNHHFILGDLILDQFYNNLHLLIAEMNKSEILIRDFLIYIYNHYENQINQISNIFETTKQAIFNTYLDIIADSSNSKNQKIDAIIKQEILSLTINLPPRPETLRPQDFKKSDSFYWNVVSYDASSYLVMNFIINNNQFQDLSTVDAFYTPKNYLELQNNGKNYNISESVNLSIGAMLYAAIYPNALYFVLAHEIAHKIGPNTSTLNHHNIYDRQQYLMNCLKSKESILMLENQIEESWADWMATESLSRLKITTSKNDLINETVGIFCLIESQASNQFNSYSSINTSDHPETILRINGILAAHPSVRKFIGCESQVTQSGLNNQSLYRYCPFK